MVIFITGGSHTEKTALAQRLLETYHCPYLSIDHLKTSLIRSGHTSPTPEDDDMLIACLWPTIHEIARTAIENQQNLVIGGYYIPSDWKQDFDKNYLERIRYYHLITTEYYINKHFTDIQRYVDTVKEQLDGTWLIRENLILDNTKNPAMCR